MRLEDRSHDMWHVEGYCVRAGDAPSTSKPTWKFDLWVFAQDGEVGQEVQTVLEAVKTILASEGCRLTTVDAITRKAVLFLFQNGDPAFLAWNDRPQYSPTPGDS